MAAYIKNINQLDQAKKYSYADYLLWRFKERVELFKGKILKMSPAPSRMHQDVILNVIRQFDKYFQKSNCNLYIAPFDVRIPDNKKSVADKNVYNVVQPDLCIVCDASKLDDKGCIGAPDLIVEILSPGNSKKEMDIKYDLYEKSGVKEYWMIHPKEKTINIYSLENEKYIGLKPYTEGQIAKSVIFPQLKIKLDDVFAF